MLYSGYTRGDLQGNDRSVEKIFKLNITSNNMFFCIHPYIQAFVFSLQKSYNIGVVFKFRQYFIKPVFTAVFNLSSLTIVHKFCCTRDIQLMPINCQQFHQTKKVKNNVGMQCTILKRPCFEQLTYYEIIGNREQHGDCKLNEQIW